MTTPRQFAANRVNARRSTGPRTLAGRRKASRNALKHGLSLPLLADPRYQKQALALAEVLQAELALDETAAGAILQVAEAQIDLVRVRAARAAMIAQVSQLVGVIDGSGSNLEERGTEAKPASVLLRQMAALERYEKRAVARRNSAIRHLTRVQRGGGL